jgi:hypothetical protein
VLQQFKSVQVAQADNVQAEILETAPLLPLQQLATFQQPMAMHRYLIQFQ